MNIKEIELKNFRNYNTLNLKFHEKVNIFVGDNAQGKTNLLEAIYMTSLSKSFRTVKDIEMIGFGKEFCRIKTITEKEDGDVTVEIAIGGEGKAIKIDGVKAKKSSELLEKIYVVAFTPEDLRIVKDEPEKRRKFIDRELCMIKPSYYMTLSNYKKTLMQRNAYLKEKDINEMILDIWDAKLVEYGTKIILYRKEFVEELNEISKRKQNEITENKESLEIYYDSNINFNENKKEIFIKCNSSKTEVNNAKEELKKIIYEKFLSELIKNRNNDIYKRTTTRGPHKDDLKICVNGIDIRHFGSQGQQRTSALSLKLAELDLIKIETGEAAILLLDDVLSELDVKRQQFLINSLKENQLFITTTEISDKLKEYLPEGKTYFVKNAKIINKTADIY